MNLCQSPLQIGKHPSIGAGWEKFSQKVSDTACHFMFWLLRVSHAERWKDFPFAAAIADLHAHTHTSSRQLGG